MSIISLLLLLVVEVLILRIDPCIGSSSTSTSSSSSNLNTAVLSSLSRRNAWLGRSSKRKTTKSINNNNNNNNNKTIVIQLYEIEKLINNTYWVHDCWKDSNGDILCNQTPTNYTILPIDNDDESTTTTTTYTWLGEWKIVINTGNSTNQHGWVYYDNDTTRQRTWIRLVMVQYHTTTTSLTTTTTTKKKKKRKNFIQQFIYNEWNFKGYGISIYKSILYTKSFGIGLRLPITMNFGIFERQLSLPSLSTSISYYPYPKSTLVISFNVSIRMEYIRYILHIFNVIIPIIIYTIVWYITKGLLLAISAIVFPITKQLILLSNDNNNNNNPWKNIKQHIQNDKPQYSRTIEERIGFTHSYRIHYFSLIQIIISNNIIKQLPIIQKQKQFLNNNNNNNNIMKYYYETRNSYWHTYSCPLINIIPILPSSFISRHSSAMGWSISAPVPDDGLFCTISALLSMSGFYLHTNNKSITSRNNDNNNNNNKKNTNSNIITSKKKTKTIKSKQVKQQQEEQEIEEHNDNDNNNIMISSSVGQNNNNNTIIIDDDDDDDDETSVTTTMTSSSSSMTATSSSWDDDNDDGKIIIKKNNVTNNNNNNRIVTTS